jgi:RNA polymerase sigma-70 factor (ECF subfamily)
MDEADASLRRWRAYLLLLARLQLGHDDPAASDMVQETLLDAQRDADKFRGTNSAATAAWLRKLLACNLADAWRRRHAGKRDADRERSLEAALDASSVWLAAFVADEPSPSAHAERGEQAARLATALSALPEAQRRAIEMRHLLGKPLDEISRQLNRSPAAVAGLLKRGLRQLREQLQEPDRP